MTIRTRPATPEYREGRDRLFARGAAPRVWQGRLELPSCPADCTRGRGAHLHGERVYCGGRYDPELTRWWAEAGRPADVLDAPVHVDDTETKAPRADRPEAPHHEERGPHDAKQG